MKHSWSDFIVHLPNDISELYQIGSDYVGHKIIEILTTPSPVKDYYLIKLENYISGIGIHIFSILSVVIYLSLKLLRLP